jgi:hypothetical protein
LKNRSLSFYYDWSFTSITPCVLIEWYFSTGSLYLPAS